MRKPTSQVNIKDGQAQKPEIKKRQAPKAVVPASAKVQRRSSSPQEHSGKASSMSYFHQIEKTFMAMFLNNKDYCEALTNCTIPIFDDYNALSAQELQLKQEMKMLMRGGVSKSSQALNSRLKKARDIQSQEKELLCSSPNSLAWKKICNKVYHQVLGSFHKAFHLANQKILRFPLNLNNQENIEHLVKFTLETTQRKQVKYHPEILALLLKRLKEYVSEEYPAGVEAFFEAYQKKNFRASFNYDFLNREKVKEAFEKKKISSKPSFRSKMVTQFSRELQRVMLSTAGMNTAEPGGARAAEQPTGDRAQQTSLSPLSLQESCVQGAASILPRQRSNVPSPAYHADMDTSEPGGAREATGSPWMSCAQGPASVPYQPSPARAVSPGLKNLQETSVACYHQVSQGQKRAPDLTRWAAAFPSHFAVTENPVVEGVSPSTRKEDAANGHIHARLSVFGSIARGGRPVLGVGEEEHFNRSSKRRNIFKDAAFSRPLMSTEFLDQP